MDSALNLELLKVLLQIAWGDHALAPAEVAALNRVADAMGMSSEDASRFRSWLQQKEPLPPPDLGLLRRHKDHVMRAAEYIVRADGNVGLDEAEVLVELRAMLETARS